jgi:hypothetical protein
MELEAIARMGAEGAIDPALAAGAGGAATAALLGEYAGPARFATPMRTPRAQVGARAGAGRGGSLGRGEAAGWLCLGRGAALLAAAASRRVGLRLRGARALATPDAGRAPPGPGPSSRPLSQPGCPP